MWHGGSIPTGTTETVGMLATWIVLSSGGSTDPALFDSLRQIVSAGRRRVRALETANLLPGAIFHSEVIPTTDRPTASGSSGMVSDGPEDAP